MKNQPTFLLSVIQKKYNKLYSRLLKAISTGRLAHFSATKKRQLFICLLRYEKKLKHWGIAAATSAALLLPTDMWAQPVQVGSEFQVNTYTSDSHNQPAVAMDNDGDFVVTWSKTVQGGYSQIYAQRFDSAGLAQGSEFLVNTFQTIYGYSPTIAMDNDGDFVIAWTGQDQNYLGVFAQRYNSGGVAQGSEFQVNSCTLSNQSHPSVAMDSDGDFIITWYSQYEVDQYCNSELWDVYAQRFNSAGVPQGSEFQVNTNTIGEQHDPSVAMDSDGDFVIVWRSNQDGDIANIYARQFNNAGVAQGNEFLVNTYTTNLQQRPAVAMDSDGNFVVAWDSNTQDGNDIGIYAQRYNNVGATQGNEFLVNTYTTNSQKNPSIAMDSDGDFVITWFSSIINTNFGQGGSSDDVYAQSYNSEGIPLGNEFQVNTYITDDQHYPSVAMDGDGNFVVVWNSIGQVGNGSGIFAQRYTAAPCIPQNWFADADDDGYGIGTAISACEQPANTVANNTDCNDSDMAIHPGAVELCNALDDDCDNHVDENVLVCPEPTGLFTTNITSTSATLNWTQVPCARKYKIKYIRIPLTSSTKISVGNTGSTNIGGLIPDSQYKWNIRSKCNGLLSSASPWQYFTTLGMQLQKTINGNTPPDYDYSGFTDSNSTLFLFPNPASGNVRVTSSGKTFQQLTITDLTGRIVWQQTDLEAKELDINIQHLAPGLYYLHAQSGSESTVMPLVIMQ
jgi:hypothetical protein